MPSPSSSPLRDDWGGRDRKDDITAEEWIHDKSTNSDLHKCTIGVVGKVVGTNRLVSAIRTSQGKWPEWTSPMRSNTANCDEKQAVRKTNLYNIVVIVDQSRGSPRFLQTVLALLTYPWVEYIRQDNRSSTRRTDNSLVRPATKRHSTLHSEDYNETLFSKKYV